MDIGYCLKIETGVCRAEGLHGESNALAFAAKLGIAVEGSTLYSVYSPCRTCCNMIRVAGIVEVIYEEVYSGFPEGPEYLKEIGITCRKIKR